MDRRERRAKGGERGWVAGWVGKEQGKWGGAHTMGACEGAAVPVAASVSTLS